MLFERTPEREFDPSYALDVLVGYLDVLGLEHQWEKSGDDTFPIYKAFIYDRPASTRWIGGGKGFKQQCLASALAECVQHYTAFNTVLDYDDNQMPLLSADEVVDSSAMRRFAKFSQIFRGCAQENFYTLRYIDIDDSDYFHYPVALTEPRYPKLRHASSSAANSLLWRSHDTGSSLGMSYNEALLHGVTEWIEKHSFSLFLRKVLVENGPGDELESIDKHSLPKHVYELIEHVEKQFNDDLLLVFVRNEFDIPCVLTLFGRQADCIVQPKGLACSLNRQYAVEKSIFEALQSRLLRNSNTEQRERQIVENFAEYPLFLRAYRLAETREAARVVSYEELPSRTDLDLAQQIYTISERLQANGGYKIYRHVYHDEPGGLTSLHVLIPGFNESFLIKEGKFILELT